VLQRGDVLRIVGPEFIIQRATANIAPDASIDFVVLGLAIFLGGVIGVLVTFSVGGVKISLSTSVGTLLAGLLVGYLRTRYPLFGRIPDGAVALMTSLGLGAFVGLTGIPAGPIFLTALREAGIGLFLGGVVVTLLPQLVGLPFGHFALRMNPIMLLGALAGGQTVTAAMAAVQERGCWAICQHIQSRTSCSPLGDRSSFTSSPARHSAIQPADRPHTRSGSMSQMGHSRPGRACSKYCHVRYAAESGSKFREIAALPTGYCGLMAPAQDVIQAPKPESRIMRAANSAPP
jgi:AspT/YidE/YbjL antiporter-like protein